MLNFGLVDGVVPEPLGGAHWDYDEAAQLLKKHLLPIIAELKQVPAAQRVINRIRKFGSMGFYEEKPVEEVSA
jgi:acetyl-CoA carboxylase carboxyl transferase subunit alpha